MKTESNTVSKVMTAKEACAFVRCTKAHLYNIAKGKVRGLPPLKQIRIGRRVLFFRDSLEEWLRKVEAQSQTEKGLAIGGKQSDSVGA